MNFRGLPGGPGVKNPPTNQGTWVRFLVWKIPHDTEQLSTCSANYQAPALELTSHNY